MIRQSRFIAVVGAFYEKAHFVKADVAAPLRSGATALCPSRYAIVRLPADEAILRAAVVAVLKERSG